MTNHTTYSPPQKTIQAPALTIPTVEEYQKAQSDLAAGMELLAKEFGYEDDPAGFGQKLAEAQDPPRDHCPYSAEIVQDWYNSKLVPSPAVMATLQSLCGEEYEQAYDHLADAWDIASQEPADLQFRYFKTLMGNIGSEKKVFFDVMHELSTHFSQPLKINAIYGVVDGRNPITDEFLYYLPDMLEMLEISDDIIDGIMADCKHLQQLSQDTKHHHPNEFNRRFKHSQEILDLSLDKYADKLAEKGYCAENKKKFSEANITYASNGKIKNLYYKLAQATDSLLQENRKSHSPSLCTLYDQQLRERADAQWQIGQRDESLGLMLRAIRNRMGFDQREIGNLLQKTKLSIFNYEKDLRQGPSEKSHGNTLFPDYCAMIEKWEQTEGTPGKASVDAGAKPWFDDTKKQQLHDAFKQAIEARSNAMTPSKATRNFLPPLEEMEPVIEQKKQRLAFSTSHTTQFGNALHESKLPSRVNIEGWTRTAPRGNSSGGRAV